MVAEIETAFEQAIDNFDEFRNKDNLLDNPVTEDDPFGPTVRSNSIDEKGEAKDDVENDSDVGDIASLSPRAPSRSMVNPSRAVPSGVVEPIINERPPVAIFQRAQTKVYKLMEKDPYVRYATDCLYRYFRKTKVLVQST